MISKRVLLGYMTPFVDGNMAFSARLCHIKKHPSLNLRGGKSLFWCFSIVVLIEETAVLRCVLNFDPESREGF